MKITVYALISAFVFAHSTNAAKTRGERATSMQAAGFTNDDFVGPCKAFQTSLASQIANTLLLRDQHGMDCIIFLLKGDHLDRANWIEEAYEIDINQKMPAPPVKKNAKPIPTTSYLMHAVKSQDDKVAVGLIKMGANLDEHDSKNWTPFIHAAKQDSAVILQAIIDRSYLVTVRPDNYQFALSQAVLHGLNKVVNLLVTKYAKRVTLKKDSFQQMDSVSLLMYGNVHPSRKMAIAKSLVAATNVRFSYKDAIDWSYSKEEVEIFKFWVDAYKKKLEDGKYVDEPSLQSPKPLHFRIEHFVNHYDRSRVVMYNYLILSGIEKGVVDDKGNDAFMRHPSIDFAASFLSIGYDMTRRNNDGETIFLIAIKKQQGELVAYLLSNSPIENLINLPNPKTGYTPLMTSISPSGSYSDNPAIFELLLSKGADVKPRTLKGDNAFLLAVKAGQLRMASQILGKDKTQIKSVDNEGTTALIAAVTRGWSQDVNMVDYLLKSGADIMATDNGGRSAIDHQLARYNKYTSIDVLQLMQRHLARLLEATKLEPKHDTAMVKLMTMKNLALIHKTEDKRDYSASVRENNREYERKQEAARANDKGVNNLSMSWATSKPRGNRNTSPWSGW